MNLKLTSVLSSIGRMSKAPAVRFIKSGNLSGFTALSGKHLKVLTGQSYIMQKVNL